MKPAIAIKVCPLANAEHERSMRQYAHVFHKPNVICVASAFQSLPLGYRLGVLLHEFGHLALGGCDHSEQQADGEVLWRYGIRIQRRSYNGARRLECVQLKDYSKAQKILMEYIR